MRLRADILTPNGIISNGSLEIDDTGTIAEIIGQSSRSPDFDFSGALVVPGFVDLHVHGAGGSDFMDGSVDASRTVARTHARFGTTSLLATTLTAEREDIDRAIKAAVETMDHPGEDEAAIRGIHLEGPYICTSRRGAQPEAPIRPPDIDELEHWQSLSGGRIKQITLAPELPGALEFTSFAAAIGINVSVGHTDATCSEVEAAISSGARMGTHLFNAMSPLSHRAPGTVGALLTDDRVTCELICDGFHVDPVVVKLAVRAKGVDRIVLITDAMSGASMPDGDYSLGGNRVIVSKGTAKFADGTLAGSVLTMNWAFHNITRFSDSSLVDSSKMSSLNAATLLKLENLIGTLEPGRCADLAALDRETGEVLATFRSGRLIYRL